MKCDELKAEPMIINDDYTALYYAKESVDEAIDELKMEHHRERDEYIDWVNKLQRENSELKAMVTKGTATPIGLNGTMKAGRQTRIFSNLKENKMNGQISFPNELLKLCKRACDRIAKEIK